LARPNYSYEKRQKELAKQKKKEEKRQRKLANRDNQSGEATSEEVISEDAIEQHSSAGDHPTES
jgi:hypothetical protein